MQSRLSLIIIICAAIAIAGCMGTQNPPGTPTPTSGTSTTTSPTGGNLVPSPTDVMPEYNAVTVDVGQKDYLGTIPVIFQGGMGLGHTKKIDVKLTRSDGIVQTTIIGTKKGDSVELQGTKQTDRVEVSVSMDNGQSYKIIDVLSPYRTRG
jgi:hypothetical protein